MRSGLGTVWLTFYRAWQQTSDLEIVDALSAALEKRGLAVGAFYCQSLREPMITPTSGIS
jgi:cobalamin biosynthesis Mg chelatase CobN